jgi:LacI family transcriptional regulator
MLELEWPYRRHCDVYAGAQQFAQEHGWDCVVDEYAGATLQASDRRKPAYDGVIARATPELAEQAERCDVPVVNVWFNSPVATRFPGVYPDGAALGKLAAEHLLERGFRRFACVSGAGDRFQGIELIGFHKVIMEAGFTCQCARVPRQFTKNRATWDSFHRALDKWITSWQPPLGVYISFPDVVGRIIAESCRSHGVIVPDNAALVACEDEPTLCLYPSPSLTSIDVSHRQIGFTAAKLLDQMMQGKKLKGGETWIAPIGIIARQSTDFFAVDDAMVEAGLRFISANVQRPIQVDDVSKGCFAGRRTLERRFRAVLGRSVADEIIRLRVERAKRELAGTESSVKTIASNTGFRDAKRMHEVFMREVGVSPTQYRASWRKE